MPNTVHLTANPVSFRGAGFSLRRTSEELAKFEETACSRARLGNSTLKGIHLPSRAQRAPREGAVMLPSFTGTSEVRRRLKPAEAKCHLLFPDVGFCSMVVLIPSPFRRKASSGSHRLSPGSLLVPRVDAAYYIG